MDEIRENKMRIWLDDVREMSEGFDYWKIIK